MKRIAFLDFVRIFACFLVILVHASENYYGVLEGAESDMAGTASWLADETDRVAVSVYDGFSRMSVPLFMIVSAFLLVPMKKDETMRTFYKKRFLRIIPPMLVFMVLYSTLPLLWGGLSAETSLFDLSHLPLNFPTMAGHLWFMYPLISIYLFTPMISPWLRTATARQERFFIMLFAISTCIPYLNRFFGDVWGQCFWNEYHALWYFSGYLGYVVTAHYIRVHLDWSTGRRLLVGGAMMAVGAVWTILSFYLQAVPQTVLVTPEIELGWAFCTINCVLLTVGAFLMFTCIKSESACVANLSRLTFGIYLMHIFWLALWVSILKPALPTPLAIPAIAVATFVTCWIVTKLLSYVPGSYWLLGVDRPLKSTGR